MCEEFGEFSMQDFALEDKLAAALDTTVGRGTQQGCWQWQSPDADFADSFAALALVLRVQLPHYSAE